MNPGSFVHLLANLAFGTTAEAGDKALDKAVQRALDTGKQSTVTIKLTIKPLDGDMGQVEISDSITAKIPEKGRGQSLMFVTTDGNLTRDNPSEATAGGTLHAIGE